MQNKKRLSAQSYSQTNETMIPLIQRVSGCAVGLSLAMVKYAEGAET